MAQTMTASRATYQNNYPTASSSVSTDVHHTWHAQTHSSHGQSNGINGVSHVRPKPVQSTATTTTISHRTTHTIKNGVAREVILIDSVSPPPPVQSSSKRKREHSVSTGTAGSAVTKRARKSQQDQTSLQSTRTQTTITKPPTVSWFKDESGVFRAREVIVPKVEDVSSPFVLISRKNIQSVRL